MQIQEKNLREQDLNDEQKFAQLLRFFFTRMMVLSEKSVDELVEYLEPQGHGIQPGLESYYEFSESLTARVHEIKKVLKAKTSHQFLEKYNERCATLARQLNKGREQTAKRVLSDVIGNRMIGIKKPTPFKVHLNGELRAIKLNERKAAEKGWQKVLLSCLCKLDNLEADVEDLELLAEKLKLPRANSQLSKYAFFLKEICSPKDLIKACVAVIDGEPGILPTIPRPDPGKAMEVWAFCRIMTQHDLARYNLIAPGAKVEIVVYGGNLDAFILSFEELALA